MQTLRTPGHEPSTSCQLSADLLPIAFRPLGVKDKSTWMGYSATWFLTNLSHTWASRVTEVARLHFRQAGSKALRTESERIGTPWINWCHPVKFNNIQGSNHWAVARTNPDERTMDHRKLPSLAGIQNFTSKQTSINNFFNHYDTELP